MGPNDFIDIMLKFMPYLVGAGGIIAAIVYRHQNKRIKEAEAKESEAHASQQNVATQSQEIDLGKKYIQESIALLETVKQLQETNNTDTARIVERIDTVEKKVTNMSRSVSGYNKRLGTIERYLNGNLKEFAAKEAESHKKA